MARRQQPNAAEKRWLKDVCEFIDSEGLGILYGSEFEGRTDYQIHHVLGRTARHNKVDIGHWFILPVPKELHDVHSNHPDNVTHFKKNFTKRFGKQTYLFEKMCDELFKAEIYSSPYHVMREILDTNA